MTVSVCDRELSAHFYSAASMKYTWHDTTPSHIILTLGLPGLALPHKSWCEKQLVPFLTTLVCRGLGSNPWPPFPQSRHSTYWVIGAGNCLYEDMCVVKISGPHQANLVLIAYASTESSGEPAYLRSLARTSTARSYKQWVKRNLQTESQIPGPSEWLGMCS